MGKGHNGETFFETGSALPFSCLKVTRPLVVSAAFMRDSDKNGKYIIFLLVSFCSVEN